MPSRRALTTVIGLLALVAALLATASPARADAAPFELRPLVPAGAGYQDRLRAEVAYWTLGKMADAGLNNEDADATPPPGGWDDLSKPWPRGQGLVSRTAGKLFMEYTDVDTGAVSTSSCSGNVVTSANRSVVLTAAHCLRVHTPLDIGFGNVVATNMVFVPAFDGTNLPRDPSGTRVPGRDIAPYGVWGVTRQWITHTWSQSADWLLGRDMAAVLVDNPDDPRPVGEVTGGQEVAFNQPQNRAARIFGYPTINERNYYRPAMCPPLSSGPSTAGA
ncbi:hypothetical protein [Streptomyces sp. NPDC047841]|uniref:trypsin-like serine peptidase n=1 Tax=Streptomyces sp. NPDC047841 TaxID=3154708 RepID=UPI0034567A3F